MPGAKLRVAFDAHNLSLAEGTGIATYTRNLESALLSFGAEVHALFGIPVAGGECPPEVAFFDGFRHERPRGSFARLRRRVRIAAQGLLRGWGPIAATPV